MKKRLKAGVLLYALLMAAVLSLLLNVYTQRLKAAYRIQEAQLVSSQAYLLAELAKPLAKEVSGEILFDKGRVVYQFHGDNLEMIVTTNQQEFTYKFLKEAPPLPKDKAEKIGAKKEEKISQTSSNTGSEPL
ncbi:competence type IV pilus minor pilin ComGG [Streptococcus pluranimalium]|uniref:competence type IV pilus minor pilin ComGG n=1 Tax=Streptococcus pluranimalium TaxID=82348 RepID=UPI002A7B2E56|nr:competence type IV pilus minor pilin ComGG [Streptococcus pluranimalium]